MNEEQQQFRQFQAGFGGQPAGPLAKVITFVLGAVLMVVGFMFSLVALAIVAVAVVLVGAWFWWKTRAVRREIREQMSQQQNQQQNQQPPFAREQSQRTGRIIEGEVIREEEATIVSRRLPE